MAGLAPVLPLARDEVDGYALIKDFKTLAEQNLKMLLLTAQGERMMDPEFGVGLKNYLFEVDHHTTYSRLDTAIRSQVRKYFPYMEIRNIEFIGGNDDHLLSINIIYFIKPLKITSSLVFEYNYKFSDLTLVVD